MLNDPAYVVPAADMQQTQSKRSVFSIVHDIADSVEEVRGVVRYLPISLDGRSMHSGGSGVRYIIFVGTRIGPYPGVPVDESIGLCEQSGVGRWMYINHAGGWLD